MEGRQKGKSLSQKTTEPGHKEKRFWISKTPSLHASPPPAPASQPASQRTFLLEIALQHQKPLPTKRT